MSTAQLPMSHLRIEHAAAVSDTDLVALDAISVDKDLQIRTKGLDQDTVVSYSDVYKLGGARAMPPLVVFALKVPHKCLLLASGFHRLAAAKKAGLTKIPVLIREGDRRDALLFALLANKSHGLALTNADKRAMVRSLLADTEWRQWSDREVASKAGVSPNLVGGIRKTVKDAQSEKVKTKDGRLLPVKGNKDAGKKRAEKNKATSAVSAPPPTDPKGTDREPEVIDPASMSKQDIPTQPVLPTAERIPPADAGETVPLHIRQEQHIRTLICDRLESGKLKWKGASQQLMAMVLICGCEDGPDRWSQEMVEKADYTLAQVVAREVAYLIAKNLPKLNQLPAIPDLCRLFTIDHESLRVLAERAIPE